MRVCIAAAVVMTGCFDYTRLSRRNAPGNVDLATPISHENGNPARFEEAQDPGNTRVLAVAAPYFLWGHGRLDASGASREAGMELRVERYSTDGPEQVDLSHAWAVTAGYGFAQWGDGRRTDAPGAIYLEAGYRGLANEFPLDVGVGPAYDLDARHLGGEVTVRFPLVMVRTRYVAGDGFQVMAGFELPLFPFAFGWSH